MKNMSGILFWLLLPLHVVMNLASILWFALQGRGGVILRAKRDALLALTKVWRKRRAIQSTRVATVRELWRLMDKHILPARDGYFVIVPLFACLPPICGTSALRMRSY